jgi:hypothetical protein
VARRALSPVPDRSGHAEFLEWLPFPSAAMPAKFTGRGLLVDEFSVEHDLQTGAVERWRGWNGFGDVAAPSGADHCTVSSTRGRPRHPSSFGSAAQPSTVAGRRWWEHRLQVGRHPLSVPVGWRRRVCLRLACFTWLRKLQQCLFSSRR